MVQRLLVEVKETCANINHIRVEVTYVLFVILLFAIMLYLSAAYNVGQHELRVR